MKSSENKTKKFIVVSALLGLVIVVITAYFTFVHEPENFTEKYLSEIYASPASLEKHYNMKIPEVPPLMNIYVDNRVDNRKNIEVNGRRSRVIVFRNQPDVLNTKSDVRVTIAPDKIVIDNLDFYKSLGKDTIQEIQEIRKKLPTALFTNLPYYKEIPMDDFYLPKYEHQYLKWVIPELQEAGNDFAEITRRIASFAPNVNFHGIASLIIDERAPVSLVERVIKTMERSEFRSLIVTKWSGEFSLIDSLLYWGSRSFVSNILIEASFENYENGLKLYGYDNKSLFLLTKNNGESAVKENSFEEMTDSISFLANDSDDSWELKKPFEAWGSKLTIVISNYENLKFAGLIPLLRTLNSFNKKSGMELRSITKTPKKPIKAITLDEFLEKRKGKCIDWGYKRVEDWEINMKNIYNKSGEIISEDIDSSYGSIGYITNEKWW